MRSISAELTLYSISKGLFANHFEEIIKDPNIVLGRTQSEIDDMYAMFLDW